MIAFFLLPNMAIFGIFVLFPMVTNFVYSMTGGNALFLADRSFVGAQHYARLLDCGNHLDPMTCRDDKFWTAVWNTARFVVLQVTLMTAVAHGHRADPQPRAPRPQLLARRLLLPRPALAGRRRPDLALDPAAPGPAQLGDGQPRLRDRSTG